MSRKPKLKQIAVVWEKSELADQEEALAKAFQIIFEQTEADSATREKNKDTDLSVGS